MTVTVTSRYCRRVLLVSEDDGSPQGQRRAVQMYGVGCKVVQLETETEMEMEKLNKHW